MSDKQYLLEEYRSRINRVIDYIDTNLERPLKQDELALVANFSKFHFHRIFCSMVGETLRQFIQRLRVERAANQLFNNPRKSITEIAYDCGFSSSATFARAFKEFFGESASEWRKKALSGEKSKIRKIESNIKQTLSNRWKAENHTSWYTEFINNNTVWRIKMKTGLETKVEVKELQDTTLAYVRHIGPYVGDSALFEGMWNKLFKWAAPRNLLGKADTMGLIMYHDNPEVTEADKLRVSVCISVPEDTEVDGEVGKMILAAGKYAFGRFKIGPDEFKAAWDFMFGTWLPESGYQPDDGPCFELYPDDESNKEKGGKFLIDICMPVKPL